MSQINPLPKVKLIMAAFGPDEKLLDEAVQVFTKDYGSLDYVSPVIDISETTYYLKEMGPNLLKKFFAFERLATPDALVDLKLKAMALEVEGSIEDKRLVNLDPGYVFSGGLVLSTGKFTGHRLYLGQGLWGELTLHFHRGAFEPLRWTYPDYQRPDVQGFLLEIRRLWSLAL